MPESEHADRTRTGASEPVRLSVIIACYNAESTIGEQLEALATQQWSEGWEVIVVNNRCTDGSMAVVERYRERMPNLRIIDALEKQGGAYAMNTGVRAARGERLAFCDADDVVATGWVAGMAKALALHEFVSGPHEIRRLNTTEVARRRRNPQPTGIQQYKYPPYLPHAGAGNMGVTRRVFDLVGGFDENMKALFDTDFCWKVQLAGVTLQPAPEAVLHLRHRSSAGSLMRQAQSWGEWNVFIYKRYRPYGMPELGWKRGARGWLGLIRGVDALLDAERRVGWLWQLGWRWGRLKGCLKYRVIAP